MNNLDKPWEWGISRLSSNPSITPEFVMNNLDKPWEWGKWGLSHNPSITPEFVMNNLDKPWEWGISGLSHNPFTTCMLNEKRCKLYKTITPFIIPDLAKEIVDFTI
jgi:hypothetical protein